MGKTFVRYTHHGAEVWVRNILKGQHNKFCLCYDCENFKPCQEDNCPLAQANYEFCVENDMVLPVWECPKFIEGKPDFSELE